MTIRTTITITITTAVKNYYNDNNDNNNDSNKNIDNKGSNNNNSNDNDGNNNNMLFDIPYWAGLTAYFLLKQVLPIEFINSFTTMRICYFIPLRL